MIAVLAACDRRDRCVELAKAICGRGAVACDRVMPWLERQLHDLPRSERDDACALIQREQDVLAGFAEKARSELSKP